MVELVALKSRKCFSDISQNHDDKLTSGIEEMYIYIYKHSPVMINTHIFRGMSEVADNVDTYLEIASRVLCADRADGQRRVRPPPQ